MTMTGSEMIIMNGMHSRQPSLGSLGSSNDKITLKRRLNLFNGVGLIIGIIVGSGIFISPKHVLADMGSIGQYFNV